jgi:hypothetical protein
MGTHVVVHVLILSMWADCEDDEIACSGHMLAVFVFMFRLLGSHACRVYVYVYRGRAPAKAEIGQ